MSCFLKFSASTKEICKKTSTEFKACYTGSLTYSRGVKHAVEAWKTAGIKGILAGRFQSEEFKSQIDSINDTQFIDYRGWVDPDSLKNIYKESSVGMANLLNYGQYHLSCNFPTKVLEYCMYGIPVIVYKNEYIESIMNQYDFGIMVDPENIQEIADKLVFLKNNPEVLKQKGNNGRRAVEELFNWNTQEIKLIGLYKDVLEVDNRCYNED